jgi:hypothetical protein
MGNIATSANFRPFQKEFGTLRGAINLADSASAYGVRFGPQGQNYFRFEVRPGDQWSGDEGTDKERSEITPYEPKFNAGVDNWLSYAMRLPYGDPYTGSLQIMGQLHATEDAADDGLSPIWDITFAANRGPSSLQIRSRTSVENPNVTSPPATVHYTYDEFPRFQWVNFVHRLKPDYSGSGVIQSWIDGVQVVDYAGAFGFDDLLGPYFKFGIYSGEVDYVRIVEYANMEFGTTDLSDRILNPLAIPDIE